MAESPAKTRSSRRSRARQKFDDGASLSQGDVLSDGRPVGNSADLDDSDSPSMKSLASMNMSEATSAKRITVNVQGKRNEDDARKIQEDAEDLEWLRELDCRMCTQQWTITCLAIAGLLIAAMINEVCLKGDVGESCDDTYKVVFALKGLTALLTAAQIYMMLRQIELKSEYADTQATLQERGRGLSTRARVLTAQERMVKTLRQHWFFFMVLLPLNLITPFPGLSFRLTIEQLGLNTRYRSESLVVGAMLPRIYHVMLLYKLKLLTSYLALDSSLIVRNSSAIRQLNDPGLSQPQLALKIALERQPLRIIIVCWAVLLATTTYLVRVFESAEGNTFSACFAFQGCCTRTHPALASPTTAAQMRGRAGTIRMAV